MAKPSGVNFKLFGPSKTPLKYSSDMTRHTSLQQFMGGAEITEVNSVSEYNPTALPEDLEAKFKSGVNRSDMPSAWGYPITSQKIGTHAISLAANLFSWRRVGGEPLYKK